MTHEKKHTPEQSKGIKKTVILLGLVTVGLFLWSVYLVLRQAHV
ncbi:hypothetical protein GCM10011365_13520 [Marinicella pacifica]|jgi:hypothetical protein|uniref:Uncharacterized protein n=1 Tax=Marinicella pacifica TaxID=1171543 RepID=A0A917CNW0_9GAMM|nr:hypothetical protein [Marinicella pacifica]GGF93542.1 hypothetical protein GCM10011365_13520 [Marinicella pacifica]